MEQADFTRNEHLQEYQVKPAVIAVANGRFHLIGEHTWFAKDKTLSMAVDLPVFVAVSKRQDVSLRFYFSQLKDRKPAFSLAARLDGFAVVDLRFADIGFNAEFTAHTVDEDIELKLADTTNDGLASFIIGMDTEGRVFLSQLGEGA